MALLLFLFCHSFSQFYLAGFLYRHQLGHPFLRGIFFNRLEFFSVKHLPVKTTCRVQSTLSGYFYKYIKYVPTGQAIFRSRPIRRITNRADTYESGRTFGTKHLLLLMIRETIRTQMSGQRNTTSACLASWFWLVLPPIRYTLAMWTNQLECSFLTHVPLSRGVKIQ